MCRQRKENLFKGKHIFHRNITSCHVEESNVNIADLCKRNMQSDDLRPPVYLCLPCALKNVHQSKGHLLFAFHTQQWLQNCTQCSVVVGNVFSKLLVQLHGEDVHCLIARLNTQRGIDYFGTSNTTAFGQNTGLYHRVPLLHKLPARDAGDGDADKAKVCAFFLHNKQNNIFWVIISILFTI